MDSPSELTLDFRLHEQTHNLEDFLSRLEKERVKIEAFKRELPLCMQLLNNAMESYKKQLDMHRRPVLEEFMPLKSTSSAEGNPEKTPEADDVESEKTTWMTSAQLWGDATKPTIPLQTNAGQKLPSGCGVRGCLPELVLAPVEREEEKTKIRASVDQQSQRKARRCWTPDLHRRFVNALHALGGSQAATPKQIRELMNVEGLTNDEVKSHLQKYRLHTRRPMGAPQASTSAAPPQLVVLGGIWVPPEYAASSKGGQIFYGSHPAAAHYCAAAAVHQHHYHGHGASSGARTPIAPPREMKRESLDEGGSSDSTRSTEEDEDLDKDADGEEKEEEKDGKLSRVRLKM